MKLFGAIGLGLMAAGAPASTLADEPYANGFPAGPTTKTAESSGLWLVGVSPEHDIFDFVDATSVAKIGPNLRSANVIRIFEGAQIEKMSAKRVEITFSFDCRSNRSRLDRFSNFTLTGELNMSGPSPKLQWLYNGQNTLQSMEAAFVCSKPSSWLDGRYIHIIIDPLAYSDTAYSANVR